MRYEYSGQPLNILNQETVARESNPATAIWNTALPLADRTSPSIPAPSHNIAPRIGLAWTPESSGGGFMSKLLGQDATVIRGGFSMAYDPSFYNLFLNAATAAPTVFAYTLTGSSLTPMPANIVGSNLQTLYAPPAGVDPRTLSQTQFASNFKDPYSISYTLGFQRRIGNNMGFEVRYVGTQGVSLFATEDGNPYVAGYVANGFSDVLPAGVTPGVNTTCSACNGRVNPNFGVIRLRNNCGHSNYNGLQTSYNVRNLFNQLTLGRVVRLEQDDGQCQRGLQLHQFRLRRPAAGSVQYRMRGERGLSNNDIPEVAFGERELDHAVAERHRPLV